MDNWYHDWHAGKAQQLYVAHLRWQMIKRWGYPILAALGFLALYVAGKL